MNDLQNSKPGILFDFDGTLVDSMVNHFKAWSSALKLYGVECDSSSFFALEGMRLQDVARSLLNNLSASESMVAGIIRQKEAFYLQGAPSRLYPGVEELTKKLFDRQIPMAIVTSGLYSRIEASTPKSFLRRFNAVISGESTMRGKPHPDPFLLGAESLGIPATSCIAVENAPLGVRSAKASGAYTIAVCSTLSRGYFQQADEVVTSIADLLEHSSPLCRLGLL